MTKAELQKQVSIKLPKKKLTHVWIHCYKFFVITIFYDNAKNKRGNKSYTILENQAKHDFKLIYKYIFKENF
jgi:hypothetical protein